MYNTINKLKVGKDKEFIPYLFKQNKQNIKTFCKAIIHKQAKDLTIK